MSNTTEYRIGRSSGSRIVVFSVYGDPQPQGSLAINPTTHRLYNSNKKLQPWRDNVAAAARMQLDEDYEITTFPVYLDLVTWYKRPASRKNDVHMAQFPDADKVLRGVFDSLTGIVYKDDKQVTSTSHDQLYVTDEYPEPMALVIVGRL